MFASSFIALHQAATIGKMTALCNDQPALRACFHIAFEPNAEYGGFSLADQSLYLPNRLFTLDLHNVGSAEAARIIRTRIRECHRFGLFSLRVVYGSPDRFEGSILELLCEIVQSDEHVILSELPDWVFSARERALLPIFLVVPIIPNPNPDALDASTQFERFQAEHEERPSQRLLCSMPFQPLRKIYDWNYAARAIGKRCNALNLSTFCLQIGKGSQEAGGLSLQDLMYAADQYKTRANRPTTASVDTSQAPTPATHGDIEIRAEDIAPTPVPQVLPTADDWFRLIDRLLSEGDYGNCVNALNKAEGPCISAEERCEYAIRKGRLLLRMHDPSCETWLLKADAACVTLYGEAAPRRRNIIGMLQDWYLSSGEADRALDYGEIGSVHFGSTLSWSRERQFNNSLVIAKLLRIAGDLREAGRVLTNAAWKYAFLKDGDAPVRFGFEYQELFKCGIAPNLLAHFFLLTALNSTDWGDEEGARGGIIAATQMAKKCSAHPSFVARLIVEHGRIYRRLNGNSHAALRLYDEAEKQNNKDGAADVYTRFLINLNRGVAYAVLADKESLRQARRAYARAEKDAHECLIEDHTELFTLYANQSSLHLRCREYDEAIEKATQASAILELKAPDRVADIGRMHFWKGQSYVGLNRFDQAIPCLSEAERYIDIAENIPEEVRQAVRYTMAIARKGTNSL